MTVLITGASSGIGRSLAKLLAKQGNIIIGIARNKERLMELQKEIGNNFLFKICDVSNGTDVIKIIAELKKDGLVPDAVILGAAIFSNDFRPDYNPELFKKTFQVNFWGAIYFVENLLPEFLKKGSGHFIILSSVATFRPNKNSIAYPASKAAISLAFRGFDSAYRKKGTVFSTIYLGPVGTSMWDGGKSFLVTSPEKISIAIAKVLKNKKHTQFIPFFSTFLSRLGLLLSDNWYIKLRKILID